MQKTHAEFNGNLENQDGISAWKKKRKQKETLPPINSEVHLDFQE